MTNKATCWICPSNKHVDDHHVDCQKGKLSPETVPLCRRCHATIHMYRGIHMFDDEYLDRAIDIENRRRELINSQPNTVNPYQMLRREDIKRSDYWYKKHGITPPSYSGRKKSSGVIPFRIPSNPPLCGDEWLKTHLVNHTPEEIEALTIEIGCDGRRLSPISMANKRGTVKAIMRSLKGGNNG